MRHFDKSDHVNEQPWPLARRDAAIKQVDGRRNLSEDWIERVVEQFKARKFRAAQVADHVGALGLFDARLAHGGLEAGQNIVCVRIVHKTSVSGRTLTQRELYRLRILPPHKPKNMVSAYG